MVGRTPNSLLKGVGSGVDIRKQILEVPPKKGFLICLGTGILGRYEKYIKNLPGRHAG